MENAGKSPYRMASTYFHLLALAAILVAIAWVGLRAGAAQQRAHTWLMILVLMAAFAVVAGHGITGYWRGILIDGRYKMSLSRLQLLVWTIVVLSALLTAVLTNIALGSTSPLQIEIPSELWILLGISTASAVGAPAVLSTKVGKQVSAAEYQKTMNDLQSQGYAKVAKDVSYVIRNQDFAGARWGDLLKGEVVGNAATVDLGKLQMFFFTFILVLGYAAAIATLFGAEGLIEKLPAVQEGMNVLLGISHTGYLAGKTISPSKE